MTEKQIIRRYAKGKSLEVIAKESGISYWTVRQVVLKAGILRLPNRKGVPHHFDRAKAQALADKGWSRKRIAAKFGTDPQNITYHVKGLKDLRGRKYKHDEHFFDEPNPVNSYWAGFICADGCVGKDTNLVAFDLAAKDRGHLMNFKRVVKATNPIRRYGDEVFFDIRCERWKKMLKKNFNIRPLKTGKEQIPNISDALAFHFLRGFFDGDGSVEVDGKYFTFKAGSKKFLLWIRKIFKSHHSYKKDRSLWRLQLSGSVGRKAIELLYRNSTPQTRLERKHARCQNALDRDLFRYVA